MRLVMDCSSLSPTRRILVQSSCGQSSADLMRPSAVCVCSSCRSVGVNCALGSVRRVAACRTGVVSGRGLCRTARQRMELVVRGRLGTNEHGPKEYNGIYCRPRSLDCRHGIMVVDAMGEN